MSLVYLIGIGFGRLEFVAEGAPGSVRGPWGIRQHGMHVRPGGSSGPSPPGRRFAVIFTIPAKLNLLRNAAAPRDAAPKPKAVEIPGPTLQSYKDAAGQLMGRNDRILMRKRHLLGS